MSTFKWDWELEIEHNPTELGPETPYYNLYFFLGSVPSSPTDWRGSALLFEPIMSNAISTIKEFRQMNGYLMHRCEKDEDVVPYLRKHLSWRAKKRNEDEEIEKSKLKSVKVTVHGPPDGPFILRVGDELAR